MSEFNETNWNKAIIAVNERSMIDSDYRQLCLTDGRQAIAAVSDIELPDTLKVQFFGNRDDYVYNLLLPPALDPNASAETVRNQLIEWHTLCTDPTDTFPTH